MDEPFHRFEWHVAPAYEWRDWLDSRHRRVVVPKEGLASLESPSAVELAWQQCHEAKKKTGPVLCPLPEAGKARPYRPMQREHAALFQTFAAIDYHDKAAILAFAKTYGRLGVKLQHQGPFFRGTTEHLVIGESHLAWAREICLMRKAMRLARPQTEAEKAKDREAWGRHGLQPPFDERRRELEWLFNVQLQHVQGRMVVDADVPPRLSFVPLTLLAAMWLQLALSVAGDKQFRQCKFCGRLFEISTENTGFRRHREFCSGSCKTKDYRRRKHTAATLARRGADVATISSHIDTSKKTIRGWLAAVRDEGKGHD